MEYSEMTMTMARVAGKKIKVTLKDGDIIQGYCCDFTQPLDNDPEIAELGIRRGSEPGGGIIAITEPEVEKIEIL